MKIVAFVFLMKVLHRDNGNELTGEEQWSKIDQGEQFAPSYWELFLSFASILIDLNDVETTTVTSDCRLDGCRKS
jgi:hypothetical protein